MSRTVLAEPAKLPGGLVLGGEQPYAEAELRPLSGREEEWIAAHPAAPSAVAVTHLLSGCLVRIGDAEPTAELVRRLLVGDRDYLILQLRRLTLGEDFQAVLDCSGCSARIDVSFRTQDIPVQFRPQTAPTHAIPIDTASPRERQVSFRLPSGADQEATIGFESGQAAEAIFDRCLLDDGGRALSAAERQVIVDAMDELAPQVNLDLDVTCPECGKQFVMPFDTTAFFLSEIKANGDQLLREFHSLALYYHWSEAEIMDLRRDRRRAYLSLLRDALHQE